jgi:hypothetical protein
MTPACSSRRSKAARARYTDASAIVALSLCSACGGAAPGIDSTAVMEDSSAAEASGADAELASDAGAASDAAEDATPGDGAGDAGLAHDAADEPRDAIAREAGLDANGSSEAGSGEAAVPDAGGAEAGAPDAGPKKCIYPFQPNYAFCLDAGTIAETQPLTLQDTVRGAQGDCAAHPSGPGGYNLYYRLKVPGGRDTKVVATATRPTDSAVVRILGDCYSDKTETGVRGDVGGRAPVCIFNRDGVEREVIVAVGRYSGEDLRQTAQFDLSVMHLPANQPCSW